MKLSESKGELNNEWLLSFNTDTDTVTAMKSVRHLDKHNSEYLYNRNHIQITHSTVE